MTKDLWTIVGLLITNASFLFGMWKYFDARITRVYERLDTVKKGLDETYVRKESCGILHTSTADNLKSVEGRIKDRLDKFEERMETAVTALDQKITNQMGQLFLILKNGR